MHSEAKTVRCRNCGDKGHLVADCPSKNRGPKCFECSEFGHIAIDCPTKKTKCSCVASCPTNKKCQLEVSLNDRQVTTLIDTGCDLCLIRVDKYIELGAPTLRKRTIRFRCIGSELNKTLGEFDTNILINDDEHAITIHVVLDEVMKHTLLTDRQRLFKYGNVDDRKRESFYPEVT